MTELWPNFMQIILHNSMNPHWIPTKIGTKMDFLKFVPSFSLICIHICVLWPKMQSVQNKDEKMNWNYAHSYLRIGMSNMLQIWWAGLPIWQASVQQIWLNLGKKSWCDNEIFLLPVNIPMVASWLHDTLPCVLILCWWSTVINVVVPTI